MRMSQCSCKVSTLSNGELLCWPAEGHDPSHQGHPVAQDKLLQGAWHPLKSLLITYHPNKCVLWPKEPPLNPILHALTRLSSTCCVRVWQVLGQKVSEFYSFIIHYSFSSLLSLMHHWPLGCSLCQNLIYTTDSDWSGGIDSFSTTAALTVVHAQSQVYSRMLLVILGLSFLVIGKSIVINTVCL